MAKQITESTGWMLKTNYLPWCDELVVSGYDWKEYHSSPVLGIDEGGDYHLCFVRETRFSDESFYEWFAVGRDGYEVDDIVYWQYLPAKPDAGRR